MSFFNSNANAQRKAGIVLGYANIIVKNLVNLAYTPMLLSFVGQGDYGVFEMSNSFVYSLTLLNFGFSGAYVRFYMQRAEKGDDAAVRRLNGAYLLLYFAISVLVLLLGLVFASNAEFVFSGGLTASEIELAGKLMVVMSVNLAVTMFSNVFNGYITACERFSFQQSRQMLTTLASPFLSLLLLWIGFGVIGVAFAQLAINALLLFLNIAYSTHTLGMRFALREREKGLFKALAVFSGWLFLNQICDLVNHNVPNVILGALSSSATVAVFAIALKIKNVFISISGIIANVYVPLVNRIVAKSNDNAELTRIMTKVGRYQMMLQCWVLGGFVVLGQWFVNTWAGLEYAPAYLIVIIMIFPNLVPFCQNVGIEIQKAKNMHQARSIVYVLCACINVALTLLLAKRLGYWAPVVGYDLQVITGPCIFMNWYYQKWVGLDMLYYWKRVLPVFLWACVPTAACLAGTVLVPVSNLLFFLAWGIVYSALFAALAWRFLLNADEKAKVRGKLARRKAS